MKGLLSGSRECGISSEIDDSSVVYQGIDEAMLAEADLVDSLLAFTTGIVRRTSSAEKLEDESTNLLKCVEIGLNRHQFFFKIFDEFSFSFDHLGSSSSYEVFV